MTANTITYYNKRGRVLSSPQSHHHILTWDSDLEVCSSTEMHKQDIKKDKKTNACQSSASIQVPSRPFQGHPH